MWPSKELREALKIARFGDTLDLALEALRTLADPVLKVGAGPSSQNEEPEQGGLIRSSMVTDGSPRRAPRGVAREAVLIIGRESL